MAKSLSPAPRGRNVNQAPMPGGNSNNTDDEKNANGRGRDGRGRTASPMPTNRSGGTATKSVPAVPFDESSSKPPAPPKAMPPSIYDYGALDRVPEHDDNDDFEAAVKRCIPSEFVLIASQDDISKAQEDHYAMEHFLLPPPDGRRRWRSYELAGSVATCALLQMMYETPEAWVAKPDSPLQLKVIMEEEQDQQPPTEERQPIVEQEEPTEKKQPVEKEPVEEISEASNSDRADDLANSDANLAQAIPTDADAGDGSKSPTEDAAAAEREEPVPRPKDKPWSTLEILQEMQERIKKCSRQDANPTISSSRALGPPRFDEGVYAPYYVVPPNHLDGTRRALLMACVSGEEKDLLGTINDIQNMKYFLVTHCGFEEHNIVMLRESTQAPPEEQPTKKNMLAGFAKIVRESKAGDVNFVQFSGHGNRSNSNLYILPSDYKKSGYIEDEKLLKNFIKAMPADVYTTFLVDCCYSGTVGDLPYILKTTSLEQEIEKDFDTTIAKSKNKKKPPPRRAMPRQSIQSFYNVDTRDEMIEKDETGGEEHKKLEEARKLKKTWLRFEPAKLSEFKAKEFSKKAAKKTKKGFVKAFNTVGSLAHGASEIAIEAAAQVSDAAMDAASKTSKKASKLARSMSPARRTRTAPDDTKNNRGGKKSPMPTKRNPAKSSIRCILDDDIPAPSKRAKPPVRSMPSGVPSPASKGEKPPVGRISDDIPAPTSKGEKPTPRRALSSPTPRPKQTTAPGRDDRGISPVRCTLGDDASSKSKTVASHGPNEPKKSATPAASKKTKKALSPAPMRPTKNASPTPVKPKVSSPMKPSNPKDEDEELREFEEAAEKANKQILPSDPKDDDEEIREFEKAAEKANNARAEKKEADRKSNRKHSPTRDKPPSYNWEQHSTSPKTD